MNCYFEKWAKQHKYKLTIDKEKPEIYTNTHTQSAWEGWKAAQKLTTGDQGEADICDEPPAGQRPGD